MAIHKATLAKQISGIVEYIYPKTTADIVQYDDDNSVYDILSNLKSKIETFENDISNIIDGDEVSY